MNKINENIHITLFLLLRNHKWNDFYDTFNSNRSIIDINIRDSSKNYMLTYATIMNKLDIVKFLVKEGASIDISDENNKSILYYSIKFKYNDITSYFLEENKHSTGISLFHCRDNKGKTILNYAIKYKNIDIVKSILDIQGNPNIKDRDGNNSLHDAVYSKDIEIIKLIILNMTDINASTSTGETALHISTNFEMEDVCKLLLKGKTDPNIQEYNYEFTPLHYAVTIGNVNITRMLLEFGINPNTQDIYGNTALHYSVSYENFSCISEIINRSYTIHILNYNLRNITTMIPVHLFFTNYNPDHINYLDKFIEKSSISIRNSTGNNLLHYLAMKNIWKKYKNIIVHKKMDIFSKNGEGKTVIDYINKNDFDEFIELASTSYVNYLKRHSGKWIEDFEQVCSLDYGEITNDDKKKLQKFLSNKTSDINDIKSSEEMCISIATKKILENISKIKKGKMICEPMQKNGTCDIKINEGNTVSLCTYTGSTLDVLIGLLCLLKKHPFSCSTLSRNFINNNELCSFYKSLGVVMNNRCEFLNFEIVWIRYKLYIMESFNTVFKNCIAKNKRFIIIPLGIEMKNGNHANYIIYDKQINEIERFEPHGTSGPIELNYRPELLDSILEKKFRAINNDIKYIRPSDYLPKIGFQLFDNSEKNNKKIGDPGGFCALWSMWYVDMRLTYPDIDRKILVKKLIKNIISNNFSFKDVIRNYSSDIVLLRDEMLKYAKMDVNDWMNDNYTEEQLEKFIEKISSVLSQVLP